MPISDPHDRFFYPHHTHMKDTYNLPYRQTNHGITILYHPHWCRPCSVRWAGRVVPLCWVNFQWWGILLIWIKVGQWPTVLAGGAGGGCLGIFSLVYHFSFLSPSLREMVRYRLKYCLKGPLSPKQPTNQNAQYEIIAFKVSGKNTM